MATIADKSRTKEIINRLQTIMNNASPVPLTSGLVTVRKEDVQSLLNELEQQMDIEIKTYHEVNDRKGKILNDAKKEAERIIYQAEHTASRMRVSKRTTKVSPIDYSMLREEEKYALGNANEIYAASLVYTDEMLSEVNQLITEAYENIRGDYEIILQVLDEKVNTIENNRKELMDELQEMDREDRGQQILEISQLLSEELYNARMKKRMNSDQYDDGSVQLSLDLQEEQEERTRQAEEKALQATQALEEMKAERDELRATVWKMKQEGMEKTIRDGRMDDVQDEEVEYEIVYVTEDELEDGEEYEIEYVDEYDPEDDEEYEILYAEENEPEDVEENDDFEIWYEEDEPENGEKYEILYAEKEESESEEKDKTESVEKKEPETGEKDKTESVEKKEPETGEKDKTESVEKKEPKTGEKNKIESAKKEEPETIKKSKKDEDIRKDTDGNEYIQASMKFDDNFEIMDF